MHRALRLEEEIKPVFFGLDRMAGVGHEADGYG